jgi:mono/diheme cytochrome c family protein
MGCTVCHEGRGHATDFNRAFHSPSDKAEEARWHEAYGWHEPHYWDYPQLPAERATASCAKCHNADISLTGGGEYMRGRHLVEKLGCHGCHKIEGMTAAIRKVGPSLAHVASKVDSTFLYAWIWSPKGFRPSTRMPHFFGQPNNSSAESRPRAEQEVRGIVAYLLEKSTPFSPSEAIPEGGDPAQGKRLFEEVGCLGCHALAAAGETVADHGPDLSRAGNKLKGEWIFDWIRDPTRYFPQTHMPSLRLSEAEAADITAYLVGQGDKWHPMEAPARDADLQRTLLEDSLSSSMRRSELTAVLDGLSADGREALLGERAIAKYGCAGCHAIPGFESAGPIGTELTLWGDKFITQLDFGLMNYHGAAREMDYTHIDWATKKLQNPRLYDRGKEEHPSIHVFMITSRRTMCARS